MIPKAVILSLALAATSLLAGIDAQNSPAEEPRSENLANAVTPGARFLVTLGNSLSTQSAKAGDRFQARTIEPLPTSDGALLGPGLEVRGHVDKVEAAHQAGHARMWLTFDEIKTRSGWVPLVAELADIPGVHSVRVDYNREGGIEARTGKRQEQAEAAAAEEKEK